MATSDQHILTISPHISKSPSLTFSLALVIAAVLLAMVGFVAGPASALEGEELWEHSYGGSAQDWGFDMDLTDDGGFILTGFTRSFDVSGRDVYLVKLDAAGSQEWDTPLGGVANDVGEAVIQTSDGGYLVAGNFNIGSTYTKEGLLIKVDADGQEQWQQTYGGSGEDEFMGVVECAAGGYAMAGHTNSFGGGHKGWIVRVDAAGDLQWQRFVSLAGHGDDHFTGLVETPAGDLVASGYSGDGNTFPSFNANITALDATGTQLWSRTFDASNYDRAYAISGAPDGGFALAGKSLSMMTIWHTDASGNMLWVQHFGTITGGDGYAVMPTSDGGYLLGGHNYDYDLEGQLYLAKVDARGNALWERRYGGPGSEACRALAETPEGNYALAGITNSFGNGDDDLLLLLVEGPNDLAAVEGERPASVLSHTLSAYPNPFNPEATVSFSLAKATVTTVNVMDSRGRHVKTLLSGAALAAGPYTIRWDGHDDAGHTLGSGVYLVRVGAGGEWATSKLTMLK